MNNATQGLSDEVDPVKMVGQIAKSLGERLDRRRYIKLESFMGGSDGVKATCGPVRKTLNQHVAPDIDHVVLVALMGLATTASLVLDLKRAIIDSPRSLYEVASRRGLLASPSALFFKRMLRRDG
jgi:hypothetical protein